ncbi:hypothetical protein PG994_009573 [Apiospora phragmitis]|uniref:Uncharacterized protein n=1 Tax=Apiospora phragmitis TaxID=2905665 RepID=A0ABR1U6F6_9PEZI
MCDHVPIDMAAKLPNLRDARWKMNAWEIRYIEFRRAHRRDLAEAVAQVLPQPCALQSLTMSMKSPRSFWAPHTSAENLNPAGSNFDILSDAIRTTTSGISTLRELHVYGVMERSLFWPGAARAARESYGQNLEHVRFVFDARRPSGGLYFRDSRLLASDVCRLGSTLCSGAQGRVSRAVDGEIRAGMLANAQAEIGGTFRDHPCGSGQRWVWVCAHEKYVGGLVFQSW